MDFKKYFQIIKYKYSNNQIFFGGIFLFFLLNLGNLFSYVSIILISRNLNPYLLAEYSYINSIILYFATPTVIFSLFTAKRIINLKFYKTRTYVFFINIFISIIYSTFILIIILLIKNKFEIKSEYIFFIFLGVSSNLINGICLGFYQGLEKFKQYAFFAMLTMLIKLIFIIFLISLNKIDPLNIIIFSLISIIIDNLIMFLNLRKTKNIIEFKEISHLLKKLKIFTKFIYIFLKDISYLLTGFFLVNMFFAFDIFIAKIYLNEKDFLKYIPISILSKIPYFLSNTLAPLLYPLIAKKINVNKNLQTVLILLSSIFISLLVVAFFYLFGEIIINFTFNNQFENLHLQLIYLSIAFSLLSVINLMFNYYAPNHDYIFLVILIITYTAAFIFTFFIDLSILNNFLISINILFISIISSVFIYNLKKLK
tara:strand:+ start:302 stop:1579 length:1278 start_codon:yes stop_codon:yes gene_type:complete